MEWSEAYRALVVESYGRRRPRAAGDDVTLWDTDGGLVGVERCGSEVLVYEGVPEQRLEAFREAANEAQPWECVSPILADRAGEGETPFAALSRVRSSVRISPGFVQESILARALDGSTACRFLGTRPLQGPLPQ